MNSETFFILKDLKIMYPKTKNTNYKIKQLKNLV